MTLQLDDLKPVIDWLSAHPGLACLAVFVISCAESLAIIGLFIPGTIIMPAIGSMVGTHVLPGPWVLVAAIFGAIVGDGLSYWLGYHYHEQIRRYWPFNRFPRLLKSGEQFFLKYGGLSVFIGRFVGPVRPIIPVVAGMMSMAPLRFVSANILSAIAWAIAYMAPGFFLGAISEQLAPNTAARLLLILAIATLALWCLWWAAKRLWQWLGKKLQAIAQVGWQRLSQPTSRWHFIQQKLVFANNPLSHKPLMLLLTAIASGLAFVAVLVIVHATTWLSGIDAPIYYMLRSCALPGIDHFMVVLAAFSSMNTYLTVVLAISIWLVWRRRWRALCGWLANFVSCWLIIVAIKAIVHILRPINNILLFSNGSFPSLHGGLVVSLYMGLLMLVLPHIHRRHWAKLLVCGGLLTLLVILPHLYFGFNWFSDQLGAALIAIFIGEIWILWYYHGESKARLAAKPLWWWAVVSFVLTGALVAKFDAENFSQKLQVETIKTPFAVQDWWQGDPLPIELVRNDIFGDATELMNVQYVGHLTDLTASLEAQGWTVAPQPSLAIILNRIGAKDRLAQLPLIPDLYQAQKPRLILTKALHQPERMLVLRIWPTNVTMTPVQQPLWVATVQYRQPWWFGRKAVLATGYPSAMNLLSHDLTGFLVTRAQLPMPSCALAERSEGCEQEALFVRSVAL